MGTLKKENNESLDMDSKHLSIVKDILKQSISGKLVWVYGSRIRGTSKKHSDLDLVVFGLDSKKFSELKEAFEESNLPFRVDLLDWNKIPESFQNNINKKYIVLQNEDKKI
jgi:type I restriction enzyme S subunit